MASRTVAPRERLTIKRAERLLEQIATDANWLATFTATAMAAAGNTQAASDLQAVQMVVERIGSLADFDGGIVGDQAAWVLGAP